jgi:hypothetical protein
METDTNGFIYHGNMEQNAVSIFNPANGTVNTFVRDPRLNWVDTVSSFRMLPLHLVMTMLTFCSFLSVRMDIFTLPSTSLSSVVLATLELIAVLSRGR